MEKKETAVEYLVEQLFKIHNNTTDVKEMNSKSIIEQAKQMEKEQHEETWFSSRDEDMGDEFKVEQKSFEDYYNETYGETKN
jgi:hypothetical protein